MAKNRRNDMDSFAGIFTGTETDHWESKKDLQKNEEKLQRVEDLKQEMKQVAKSGKPGRPRMNEASKKKRYTFTIRPGICEQAQEAAYRNGESLSEVVERFLAEYIGMN